MINETVRRAIEHAIRYQVNLDRFRRDHDQSTVFPAPVSFISDGSDGEFQIQVGDTWWRVRVTRVRD